MTNDRIERIRGMVLRCGIELNASLSLSEVETFETQHGVVLPDGYLRFALHLGDGGEGPPQSGIFSLLERRKDHMRRERWDISLAFPLTTAWIWEDDDDNSDEWCERRLAVFDRGSIPIGEDGCGMVWHLIVTGPERGNVWDICGEGAVPGEPREFLAWYESWLERQVPGAKRERRGGKYAK